MNGLQIMNIKGIECYEKDGIAYLKLETVARGLGFTQEKSGVEYVKWERVESYLAELGFPHKWGKGDFIPENIFYRLAMKAKNAVAEAFQAKIADEVIPSIRKTGTYSTNALPDPKAGLAEAKVKNARARVASIWLKLAQTNPIPTYQQICAHYASAELTGGEAVLPLPEVKERTYSAAEVGELLGGVSANMVGRMANQNGLKSPEYGIEVWDKSKHSAKQVPTWRYNEKAVAKLRMLIKRGAPA